MPFSLIFLKQHTAFCVHLLANAFFHHTGTIPIIDRSMDHPSVDQFSTNHRRLSILIIDQSANHRTTDQTNQTNQSSTIHPPIDHKHGSKNEPINEPIHRTAGLKHNAPNSHDKATEVTRLKRKELCAPSRTSAPPRSRRLASLRDNAEAATT